jgi:hypothetical protein
MRTPYLPSYGSDFDPIENAFFKLKAPLRRATERTIEGLSRAIRHYLNHFPLGECAKAR